MLTRGALERVRATIRVAPAGTAGGFVTGATLANFTALAAARHALLAREGWDVEATGLFGAPDWATTDADVGRSLEAMLRAARDR